MAPGRPPGREPEPGDPFLRKPYWHAHGSRVLENLAIVEREARETEEREVLQARREQREQEEQQERERQNHIEEQGESGESRARIETASPYDRLCPSSPAARARRAV